MVKKINMAGQKFGRLMVIEEITKPAEVETTAAFWRCICDCGTKKIIEGRLLRRGVTKSCGCLRMEGRNQFSEG